MKTFRRTSFLLACTGALLGLPEVPAQSVSDQLRIQFPTLTSTLTLTVPEGQEGAFNTAPPTVTLPTGGEIPLAEQGSGNPLPPLPLIVLEPGGTGISDFVGVFRPEPGQPFVFGFASDDDPSHLESLLDDLLQRSGFGDIRGTLPTVIETEEPINVSIFLNSALAQNGLPGATAFFRSDLETVPETASTSILLGLALGGLGLLRKRLS